ncbi:MAG: polysaccharide deacetylase family protein, partial [Bdellovibrionaceae bacterium]|nr:polysaccharide deacetylase family protein [Pseudobdellovibrionaceae bacterium]
MLAFKGFNSFQSTEFQQYNIEYFSLDKTYNIALTFDDGPGKGTEKILNLLKKYNIKATFFVLGSQVKTHAHLTNRIVSEGHLLANHSYTHPQLAKNTYRLHPELLIQELQKTHALIKPYLDH